MIVVPQKIALKVAYYANEEHQGDKKRRREHYKALGRELDHTV
jgi:hypothetical protein